MWVQMLADIKFCAATQRVNDKARKSKYSRTSVKRASIKRLTFVSLPAKIPEKNCQLHTVIKPLFNGHLYWARGRGQLLAVPRVILFLIYTS